MNLSRSQATISPIVQRGWAGELSAMKGKLEPTLPGYTDLQILHNNIARPSGQPELSHGGQDVHGQLADAHAALCFSP